MGWLVHYRQWYGGWKKSCDLDGWNPMNPRINHLSTGARFRNHPKYVASKWDQQPMDRYESCHSWFSQKNANGGNGPTTTTSCNKNASDRFTRPACWSTIGHGYQTASSEIASLKCVIPNICFHVFNASTGVRKKEKSKQNTRCARTMEQSYKFQSVLSIGKMLYRSLFHLGTLLPVNWWLWRKHGVPMYPQKSGTSFDHPKFQANHSEPYPYTNRWIVPIHNCCILLYCNFLTSGNVSVIPTQGTGCWQCSTCLKVKLDKTPYQQMFEYSCRSLH